MERKASEMTNQEFDVLDELYFLTGYKDLETRSGMGTIDLKDLLWNFLQKEWVLCHQNNDQEINPTKTEFESLFSNYHYLASKKGLLAHNAR